MRFPTLIPSILAIALSLLAAPALAHSALLQVQVVDRESGRTLPEYAFGGDRWIAGTPGHRYALRVRNLTAQRVLAVLSVDGVNVITGDTAAASQSGYVLAPYESAEITGWRKSSNDIAGFVFTALPDSYAARTGRPDNVGVLGVAAFRERQPLPSPAPASKALDRLANGAAAPLAEAQSREERADNSTRQQLGTGHGEREYAPISYTTFERASQRPAQVLALRYDRRERLLAMGVIARPRPQRPQPFPLGFVPDPPPRG